jgi:hypothetical protein
VSHDNIFYFFGHILTVFDALKHNYNVTTHREYRAMSQNDTLGRCV